MLNEFNVTQSIEVLFFIAILMLYSVKATAQQTNNTTFW